MKWKNFLECLCYAAMCVVLAWFLLSISGCATGRTTVIGASGESMTQVYIAVGGAGVKAMRGEIELEKLDDGSVNIRSKNDADGITTPNTIQDMTEMFTAIGGLPQFQPRPEADAKIAIPPIRSPTGVE